MGMLKKALGGAALARLFKNRRRGMGRRGFGGRGRRGGLVGLARRFLGR